MASILVWSSNEQACPKSFNWQVKNILYHLENLNQKKCCSKFLICTTKHVTNTWILADRLAFRSLETHIHTLIHTITYLHPWHMLVFPTYWECRLHKGQCPLGQCKPTDRHASWKKEQANVELRQNRNLEKKKLLMHTMYFDIKDKKVLQKQQNSSISRDIIHIHR